MVMRAALPDPGQQVHRRRADEGRDVDGLRTREHVARRSHLDDASVHEHRDPVGERHRLFLVVRDVHRGRRERALQRVQLEPRLQAQLGVEVGQRLVEEEQARLAHDGARERAALLLAAGQLARCAREKVADADLRRGVRDSLLDGVRSGADHAQRKADVLRHRHVRVERVALEHHRDVALPRLLGGHVHAVDHDLAGAHLLETGKDAQRGGLARPGRSQQDEELAGRDRKVDAMQHRGLAVPLHDAFEAHAALVHVPPKRRCAPPPPRGRAPWGGPAARS